MVPKITPFSLRQLSWSPLNVSQNNYYVNVKGIFDYKVKAAVCLVLNAVIFFPIRAAVKTEGHLFSDEDTDTTKSDIFCVRSCEAHLTALTLCGTVFYIL